MLVKFSRYHALGNDFIILRETSHRRWTTTRLARLALSICDRRTGVGADGLLYLSSSRTADCKFHIINADGSWAEKSGNGLRIAAVHLLLHGRRRKRPVYTFQTANSVDEVTVGRKTRGGFMATVSLGRPEFDARLVPVRSRRKYMINAPLSIGGVKLPVTCLSVGNPHTVLIVNDFDFDWKSLGAEIEHHRAFPNRTNVEFVKIISRRKVEVADWERGAGATGSSGTGAAASVCAGVTMGIIDRKCEVAFQTGSLFIDWREPDDTIVLTGPVAHVADGTFEFR